MGRYYFIFVTGMFVALLSQGIDCLDAENSFETVHSLTLDDIDQVEVANHFSGEGWLSEKMATDLLDINGYYQENAFIQKLTDRSQVKLYKKGYATWIEERTCPQSPYIEEPLRSSMTSRYGRRVHPVSGRRHVHAGVDFRGRTGTPVYASSAGRVKFVRRKGAYGKAVIIDHGDKFTTLYGHLSGYAVKEGQWVNRGQTVGFIGRTGRTTGPHLHFEVRCHNIPVNPLKYLGKSGLSAEVKVHKRMRNLAPRRSPRRIASQTPRHDPNYYTRMMNMKTLENLNSSENLSSSEKKF